MSNIADTVSNLIGQTAFMNLTWGNLIMILVAFVFLFLAIKMGFEPLAGANRFWYAAGKYLPGYYGQRRRNVQWSSRTSSYFLYS